MAELRRHAGLTQEELGVKAGWSRSKVGAVERSPDPWLSQVLRYLRVLGWELTLKPKKATGILLGFKRLV